MSGVYGLDFFNYASVCDEGALGANFDSDNIAELGELECDGSIITFDTSVSAAFFFVGKNDVDVVSVGRED